MPGDDGKSHFENVDPTLSPSFYMKKNFQLLLMHFEVLSFFVLQTNTVKIQWVKIWRNLWS